MSLRASDGDPAKGHPLRGKETQGSVAPPAGLWPAESMRPCNRTRVSVFCMSLRASAHTGVAIRSPRSKTWQPGTTLGKSVALFRIRPKRCSSPCPAAGVTDCHVASLLAMTVGGRTCTRAHVFPSACHCEPVRTPAAIRFPPQKNSASWLLFGQIRSRLRIRPKYCFPSCCTARVTDCHVASLLAMTYRNMAGFSECKRALPDKPAASCRFALA